MMGEKTARPRERERELPSTRCGCCVYDSNLHVIGCLYQLYSTMHTASSQSEHLQQSNEVQTHVKRMAFSCVLLKLLLFLSYFMCQVFDKFRYVDSSINCTFALATIQKPKKKKLLCSNVLCVRLVYMLLFLFHLCITRAHSR